MLVVHRAIGLRPSAAIDLRGVELRLLLGGAHDRQKVDAADAVFVVDLVGKGGSGLCLVLQFIGARQAVFARRCIAGPMERCRQRPRR